MSTRSPTMRELLTLARERLGDAALSLKTREELLRALGLSEEPGPPAPPPPPAQERNAADVPLVTRGFFVDPTRP